MRLTDQSEHYDDGLECPRPPAAALAQRVEAWLRGSSYLSLATISCEDRDGAVVLRGRLPSYYLKQMAGALAAEVEGVRRVDNQIEIRGTTAYLPVRSAASPHGGRRG